MARPGAGAPLEKWTRVRPDRTTRVRTGSGARPGNRPETAWTGALTRQGAQEEKERARLSV